MTKVKICGLTDQAMVEATVLAGADYLGFVFAKSKRQIAPEQVLAITQAVPKKVKKVGVFVSPSLAEVTKIAEIAQLDLLQIHGVFKAELQASPLPIIQSFDGQSPRLKNQIKRSTANFILLDAPVTNERYAGGNGKTFHWQSVTPELQTLLKTRQTFIAGGLNPQNVKAARAFFSPFAVDVSSGVETNGQKDIQKIRAFIQAVKE